MTSNDHLAIPVQFWLLAGIAGTLAVVWLVHLARRGYHRWRYGPPIAHEELLVQFGRQMAALLDRRALARLLAGDASGALDASRATVLQDLCAVARDLKALEAGGGVPFEGLVGRADESVQTLRAICHDLRPPLLSNNPALAIYRIAQESLHNAIQHADASEVAACLTRYPDRLRMTITDGGRGIPDSADLGRFVAQGHFGLAGMRERAAMIGGRLDVQSAADYGTW